MPSEWMPISTVPTQTQVLLWSPDLGHYVGEFHGVGRRCEPDDAEAEATHWQSLPAPPNATSVAPQTWRSIDDLYDADGYYWMRLGVITYLTHL